MFRTALCLFLSFTVSGFVGAQPPDRPGRRSVVLSERVREKALATLPKIAKFLEHPSDRFLVDMSVVRTGHPYRGRNARRPHTGGHVYFRRPEKPVPATEVDRFPAIYAVADGVISRVDYSFRQRPTPGPGSRLRASNTRYGVGLLFARSKGHGVEMHYSIEPFIDPGDERFYEPFILVKAGQKVKKGDVIARMYIPPDRKASEATHIHFNLMAKRTFQSPSIFSTAIVTEFHATWDSRGGTDGGVRVPPCMGYKLAPRENPFGTGAKDTL